MISLPSILLIVGCAVAYSGLDLVRKILSTRIRAVPLLFFMTAGPAPLFVAWLLASGEVEVGRGYWLPAAASVLLNIVANLAFIEGVRRSPLSVTIPLLSLTPVFTTLLAVPLLGESPTPRQLLGVLAVVAGALWIHAGADGGRTPAALWRAFRNEPGSRLMVGVSFAWSLAMPFDKLAMGHASAPLHGVSLNAGVALGLLVILAVRGRLPELGSWRGHLPLLLLTAALTMAAMGLQLLAIRQVWVGLVESLKRAIGSVLAIGLGAIFFGEKPTGAKVLAVLVMAAGVALILL